MSPRHDAPNRDEYLRVRITSEQAEALQRIADEDGATVSEVVRRLVATEVRKRERR